MTTSTLKEKKEVLALRSAMDDDEGRFRFNDNVRESFANKYSYMPKSEREYYVHIGDVCTIADCYILYIIGHFGVADLYTIKRALANIKRDTGKSLLIPNTDDSKIDHLRARIVAMARRGFICASHYNLNGGAFEIDTLEKAAGAETLFLGNESKKVMGVGTGSYLVTLYSMDHEAYSVMNSKLHKKVIPKDWIQEKGDFTMIGIASSAYAASHLMANTSYRSLGNNFFKTPEFGTASVNGELIFETKDGVKTTVGMVSAYLRKDDRIMTEEDYKEECLYKLRLIRNYLYKRTYKENGAVVISVENQAELVRFSKMIFYTEGLQKYLPCIYFTSEGAIKSVDGDMTKALLRIVPNEDAALGYDFVNAKAPFLD